VEKTHKDGMAFSVYEVKENHDTETLTRPVGEGFKPRSLDLPSKGRFTHSMPCPCRSPAMPCR